MGSASTATSRGHPLIQAGTRRRLGELTQAQLQCQLKKREEKMPKTDKPNILIIWGDDIGWFNVSMNNNRIAPRT
jgi:hypothetical protein